MITVFAGRSTNWFLGAVLVAGLALAHPAHSADPFVTTIEVLPPAPQYLERAVLRVDPSVGMILRDARIEMTGNRITVLINVDHDIGGQPKDFDLGRFPAGDFLVEVREIHPPPNNEPTLLGATQFRVPERAASTPDNSMSQPEVDYSDHWWNPVESGWGMSIAQRPSNALFAVWYIYDTNRNPVWYTLQPGKWLSPKGRKPQVRLMAHVSPPELE